jgi:hypothetical protein
MVLRRLVSGDDDGTGGAHRKRAGRNAGNGKGTSPGGTSGATAARNATSAHNAAGASVGGLRGVGAAGVSPAETNVGRARVAGSGIVSTLVANAGIVSSADGSGSTSGLGPGPGPGPGSVAGVARSAQPIASTSALTGMMPPPAGTSGTEIMPPGVSAPAGSRSVASMPLASAPAAGTWVAGTWVASAPVAGTPAARTPVAGMPVTRGPMPVSDRAPAGSGFRSLWGGGSGSRERLLPLAGFRRTRRQAMGHGLFVGSVLGVMVFVGGVSMVVARAATSGASWSHASFALLGALLLPPSVGALIGVFSGVRTGVDADELGIHSVPALPRSFGPWAAIADVRCERRRGKTIVAIYLKSGDVLRLRVPYDGKMFAHDQRFERKYFALVSLWETHRNRRSPR